MTGPRGSGVRGARSRRALLSACALLCGASACLEPAGDEHVGYSAALRPAGTQIDAVELDELLKNKIANNDAIENDMVALRSGFANGMAIRYWDFGPVLLSSLEPIWTFRRRDKHGEPQPIDHPDLIDSIPGDSNYSPLRALYVVYVTAAYAGERIASLRALEDAIELGLVEEPAEATVYVDRPVAPASAQLSFGDERAPLASEPVYYRGRVAAQFRIAGKQEHEFAIGMGPLMTPNAYALRRQSDGAALDEAVQKRDLDGDGDQDDSNLVLAVAADAPGYSALWRTVEVTVPDDYAWAASRGEADLFEKSEAGVHARAGAVLAWRSTELLRHLLIVEASDE